MHNLEFVGVLFIRLIDDLTKVKKFPPPLDIHEPQAISVRGCRVSKSMKMTLNVFVPSKTFKLDIQMCISSSLIVSAAGVAHVIYL